MSFIREDRLVTVGHFDVLKVEAANMSDVLIFCKNQSMIMSDI